MVFENKGERKKIESSAKREDKKIVRRKKRKTGVEVVLLKENEAEEIKPTKQNDWILIV